MSDITLTEPFRKIMGDINLQDLNSLRADEKEDIQFALVEHRCRMEDGHGQRHYHLAIPQGKQLELAWVPMEARRKAYASVNSCPVGNYHTLYTQNILKVDTPILSYVNLFSHVHNLRDSESIIKISKIYAYALRHYLVNFQKKIFQINKISHCVMREKLICILFFRM